MTLGGEGSEEGANTPRSLGSCFLRVHVPITCLDGPGISQRGLQHAPGHGVTCFIPTGLEHILTLFMAGTHYPVGCTFLELLSGTGSSCTTGETRRGSAALWWPCGARTLLPRGSPRRPLWGPRSSVTRAVLWALSCLSSGTGTPLVRTAEICLGFSLPHRYAPTHRAPP